MSDDADRSGLLPASERIAAAVARLERVCEHVDRLSSRHARLCDAVEAVILDLERMGATGEGRLG